jgi:hypothetical protein
MNPRSNWFLLLVAVGLGLFVWVTERHAGVVVRGGSGAVVRYDPVDAGLVGAVELMRSNSVWRAELTNGTWRLALPVRYPAQSASIQRLLDGVGRLTPSGFVTSAEVAAQPEGLRAFGLEPPAATITLHTPSGPAILRLGNGAPGGARFYFQRVGTEGVFLGPIAFLDALPNSANDWRDRTLMDLAGSAHDRVGLSVRGRVVFEAVRDGQVWRLRQPLSARADGERIEALVAQLGTVRATGFVSDDAVIDRASFGLQPPEAELTIGSGTNDLVQLQVGAIATNAPNERFVRRMPQGNLVRVAAEDLALLERPLSDFRDPRMLGALDGVDRVQLLGTNGFVVERTGTNWFVTQPRRFPAERAAVDLLLSSLAQLEVAEFVNDVVADLTPYGLNTPSREIVASSGTNRLAHLQVGRVANPAGTLLYARRIDEPSVYAVPRTILFSLESAAQLRSWHFDVTNVVSVSVLSHGRTRSLTRGPSGWSASGGTATETAGEAMDEVLHRLGAWDSTRYVVSDEAAMLKAGRIRELDHELKITLRAPAPVQTLSLRFGAEFGPSRVLLARFDDDPVALRLEIPAQLHAELVQYLGMP